MYIHVCIIYYMCIDIVHVAAVLTSVYTSLVSAPDPFLPLVLYVAMFYTPVYLHVIYRYVLAPVYKVCTSYLMCSGQEYDVSILKSYEAARETLRNDFVEGQLGKVQPR